MLFAILLSTVLSSSATQAPEVTVEVPSSYVVGRPFMVKLTCRAGDAPVALESWRATAAVFEIDGKPLGERGAGTLPLPPNSSMALELDLSSLLGSAVHGSFSLASAGGTAHDVKVYQTAESGLNFTELPAEKLKDYLVLLQTNRGDMLVEFWPDVAPKHVQNFLDLSYTGFYDGTLFHRVSPTFMIQGGDPNTKTDNKNSWGTGRGPRLLEAEFSDKKHARGVLSMARSQNPNSASSQFFIITKESSFLDHQYSVFGKLVSGDDVLDRIASAPGLRGQDGTVRPDEPQKIVKAFVVRRTDS